MEQNLATLLKFRAQAWNLYKATLSDGTFKTFKEYDAKVKALQAAEAAKKVKR